MNIKMERRRSWRWSTHTSCTSFWRVSFNLCIAYWLALFPSTHFCPDSSLLWAASSLEVCWYCFQLLKCLFEPAFSFFSLSTFTIQPTKQTNFHWNITRTWICWLHLRSHRLAFGCYELHWVKWRVSPAFHKDFQGTLTYRTHRHTSIDTHTHMK